jgi:transposase InsO family protein
MEHVRRAPYHPQTQGKIERWHQTLKNRILLDNYYLPGDLERQIDAYVEHYNNVDSNSGRNRKLGFWKWRRARSVTCNVTGDVIAIL